MKKTYKTHINKSIFILVIATIIFITISALHPYTTKAVEAVAIRPTTYDEEIDTTEEDTNSTSKNPYYSNNYLKKSTYPSQTSVSNTVTTIINFFVLFFELLPIFIIVVAIIHFNTNKRKIKNSNLDESQKIIESRKASSKLVASIVVGAILEFFSMLLNTIRSFKPIIYLYPEKDENVSVKLKYPNNITCSYPKYTTGWNVLAKPNGDLKDLDTNKNLYSLYYECKNTYNFKIEKDGFIVEGNNVAEFLEEKLSILGLNDKEKEEFIIYWLPMLEKNNYNYIRFATIDEIDKNMPLEITPTPDTIIRILMIYKPLKKKITVEEQKLLPQERTGFVAVEWGGTKIN